MDSVVDLLWTQAVVERHQVGGDTEVPGRTPHDHRPCPRLRRRPPHGGHITTAEPHEATDSSTRGYPGCGHPAEPERSANGCGRTTEPAGRRAAGGKTAQTSRRTDTRRATTG